MGADLTAAGSQLGKSIDIATFNESVDNFQTHLRDASKKLNGLKPPANTQDANKLLAGSFHDLADELEPVKDARRESIVKARAGAGQGRQVAGGRGRPDRDPAAAEARLRHVRARRALRRLDR